MKAYVMRLIAHEWDLLTGGRAPQLLEPPEKKPLRARVLAILRALWLMAWFGAVIAFCGAMLWLFGREWLNAIELAFWRAPDYLACAGADILAGLRAAALIALNGLGGMVAFGILNANLADPD